MGRSQVEFAYLWNKDHLSWILYCEYLEYPDYNQFGKLNSQIGSTEYRTWDLFIQFIVQNTEDVKLGEQKQQQFKGP